MPRQQLSDIHILSENERKVLVTDWNHTERSFPANKMVHELFEHAAAITPNSVAVVCNDISLKYQQLNEDANRLAHYLRFVGVVNEKPVCTKWRLYDCAAT